jgi:hypothetical protein
MAIYLGNALTKFSVRRNSALCTHLISVSFYISLNIKSLNELITNYQIIDYFN